MPTVITEWIQSWFGHAQVEPAAPARLPLPGDEGKGWRLRRWPNLPDAQRKARVFQLLSVLSVQPQSRATLRKKSSMREGELEGLLASWAHQGVVELI